MKYLEELKKILSPEEYQKVLAKIGDKGLYLLGDDEYIPKSKFNDELQKVKDANKKVAELESDISNRDLKISELQKKIDDSGKTTEQQVADLKKEIEDLKSVNAQDKKNLELQTKRQILHKHFADPNKKVNPKYYDDVERRLGGLEKLEIENDTIKNYDELIKPIFETYPENFGEFKFEGSGGPGGGGSGSNLDFTKDEARYRELMGKEKLTPGETNELNTLSIKIKEDRNKKQ